jgi:3-hydroxyisobutyrate dehydrogenase
MSEETTNMPLPLPLPHVAVLGAGTMGAGIALRLLEKGFVVNVWNRTPGPPANAVDNAEVVITMLTDADAVMNVMLGRSTLEAMRSKATWAQMATIGVEATGGIAGEVRLRRPDVSFVDAPVTGSREPAGNGRLLVLASGPDRSLGDGPGINDPGRTGSAQPAAA